MYTRGLRMKFIIAVHFIITKFEFMQSSDSMDRQRIFTWFDQYSRIYLAMIYIVRINFLWILFPRTASLEQLNITYGI